MNINTHISIPGRAQDVWMVLIDLASWSAWNPFIRKAEGATEEGARWKTELTLDGRFFFAVPMMILHCEPRRRLTWRGGIPALMTGRHSFKLYETAEGVTFEQSERFSGWLAPFILPLLKGALTRRFVDMNNALKAEVIRRHDEQHNNCVDIVSFRIHERNS